ncbi:MAG: N-acyl amino acid synthase FeeM domain-containing protein, partial [Usitatibacter sp.]
MAIGYRPTLFHDDTASDPSHSSPQGFEMRRASSREDWNRIRAIRYEALRVRGEIPEAPDMAYGDGHDAALNSMTYGLLSNGRMIATTRSSVSSAARRWPLPAHDAFSREIGASIGADSTLVEASLMVVAPSATTDPKTALFHLFTAHMLHCASEGADWLVVAVRDSQIGFYRRMFNMEILSGAERCPGLASPRVLMGLAYREQAALLSKRMPVLATTESEAREFAASGRVSFMAERRGSGADGRARLAP